jgi:K+-transporting ATPase ATPase A chain
MHLFDWIQLTIFISLLVALVPVLGTYMAQVFLGKHTVLHHVLLPLENFSYRLSKITPDQEMDWKGFVKALLLFNILGLCLLFVILIGQQYLPFNPQNFGPMSWDLAANTAISFVTNTNWQAYSGETTLSYGSQMWGLTVQNFLSAATGNAALLALIRGIMRKSTDRIGNFWVDLVRTIIYLLLPLAFILSLVLISQGVIQNLSPYLAAKTLENQHQVIPLGPVASQVAIKQLGTNGGGFFGANSAHPFENPNALTNFLELLAIILIPAASTYMYGILCGSRKHGWLLFGVMFLIWGGGVALSLYAENRPNPLLNALPLLEGKETRIGVLNSVLWSTSTTATANGSVNAMLASLSPLTGGVALFNLMIGELVFGGVGVGLCSMLMFVLLAIFLSGLMVGRTPEYLGKKIDKKEIQWVTLAVLMPVVLILIGTCITCTYRPVEVQIGNKNPHNFSTILYAFSSCAANNGSAFSNLDANSPFFNCFLGICMVIARLAIILPSVAIGGALAQKKTCPQSPAIFSINTFLFFSLLLGVIVIIGALTFFPALCLGPIVEHFLMEQGRAF